MEGDNGGVLEKKDLELTPTWIIALVCSFIVFISLCLERFLHFLGKVYRKLFKHIKMIKTISIILWFLLLNCVYVVFE